MKVVFLHALPFNGRMWDLQQAALGEAHEVAAPDLYPLGTSMQEWAHSIVTGTEGQFVVIGASMGGYCAGAIAMFAPERLLGVAILGSRVATDSPERRQMRDRWIEVARTEGAEGLWRELSPGLFTDESDPDVIERALGIARQQSSEDLARGVAAIRDRPDTTEALTGKLPLLVIAGSKDPLFPAGDERVLVERAQESRYIELPCGHLPSFELPNEVNRILSEWLSALG